jgi:subtilisin family serine protease
LLDQTAGGVQEFTRDQLEQMWLTGPGPGADEDGHGTHVASIASGTRHMDFEGVAPGARLLLVKTDYRNTDEAVSWIFDRAGEAPCVVNLSLGHHFGPHDGTSPEERLFDNLSGTGRIIVASAGNERNDSIHIGGRFFSGEQQTVKFDLLRRPEGNPLGIITLWFSQSDDFGFELITPAGQVLDIPAPGQTAVFGSSLLDVELSAGEYDFGNLVQVQIVVAFSNPTVPIGELEGWGIRMTCHAATIGRIDGWFNNSGFGRFQPHALIEPHRTVGIPATGASVLSVASHVSRSSWESDLGPQSDSRIVLGRTSPFSSQGPTRDGRQKPDISAPGQYLTAALAAGSSLSILDHRARTADRVLTIEGTSMSAPMATGVIALLLQRNPRLSSEDVLRILRESARHDEHTGPQPWNPSYGFGKIDVQSAMDLADQ